jgi:glycosyltransferase involved in cell wall biosynthesis
VARKRLEAVVLVHSGMLSNRRYNIGQHKNVYIIPNGISHSTAQKSDIVNFNPNGSDLIVEFCNKGLTIGSIGRLSAEKGYADLIEALRILRDEAIDAKLVIIGEGEERNKLEKLILAKDLATSVLLPGYQSAAFRYLPFFSVYANSSHTEGLPITILEAMAAEIPIVATAVGAIPEVLAYGKGGLIVPCGAPISMANALKKLASEPNKRKELIQTAKQIVTQQYSSHRMAWKYFRTYKNIIDIYTNKR